MLQKEFFQVQPFNPYPYWNGHVFFESNTPGIYHVVVPKGIKCGYISVGAGAGGFCAKTGFVIDEGSPSEQIFTGLTASSGASGKYAYSEYTFTEDTTVTINVGATHAAYASTNIYGTVSQSRPYLYIYQNGNSSNVVFPYPLHPGSYQTIVSGLGGTTAEIYLSDPNNPNSIVFKPSTGAKNGSMVAKGTNVKLAGGASVYKGYGAGGSAGWTGDNQYGTPWANAGGNGYVKIFAIMPA